MIVHVLLDGVMEGTFGVGLDIVATAARLVRAGRAAPLSRPRSIDQRVLSVDGEPVRSAQGRLVSVDGALGPRAVRPGDVVVIPGVVVTTEPSLERLLVRDDVRRLAAWLPRAVDKGVLVAASCSATFVLGEAGLLDDVGATTTWWLMPAFRRRFPGVTLRADRMVVDTGAVLTAGSAFAHADLMLSVVSRVASPTLANLVARYLVLDGRPSQSRYMVLEHLRSADPVLQTIEDHVAANLGRQIALAELARVAGTSPRTLARRVEGAAGTTPRKLVQRVRMAHAAHLLETTRASVEDVAASVGYADPAAFRRVYRAHAGESPRRRLR